jgi:hypothetical protein
MCFEERRCYGVGTWLSEGLELFIERWKLLMAGLLILIAISWVVDFITGVDPTLMCTCLAWGASGWGPFALGQCQEAKFT